MLIYLFLFISFFQVGLLGIGGNPAAQALLEHETITLHQWISPAQLSDLMVFCRTLPGGTGLNTATLVGALTTANKLGFWASILASIVSVFGIATPAVIWSAVIKKMKGNQTHKDLIECVMTLLRPLVPGLIAAAAILMMNKDNFGSPETTPWQFGVSVFLFLATIIGTTLYRFNGLFMVILCGIAGWILL